MKYLSDNLDRYKQHCCMYGAATHFVTGYPCFFLGGGHVISKSPKGWFDEAGFNSSEQIALNWGIEHDLIELTEFDYKWLQKYEFRVGMRL